MAYERDIGCVGYLLVPSLNMNQLHDQYEISTGTWPQKFNQSLRGLHVCIRLWFPPEAASMCTCWTFGTLAAMSPCMCPLCAGTRVCVCVLDQGHASLHTMLTFQWSTVQPFQQGSSSCEVLNKNWQDKFACWVYRVCTLNAPRGFWEIKPRINLILFFCWKPSFCSKYTVLDNLGLHHILYFTIRPFRFTVLTRNCSGKLWLKFIHLSIPVPFLNSLF